MRIKICGITNIEDALFCEKMGANALGFIFYKKSKRFIEPVKAEKIIAGLSPFTMKVGVFVNASSEEINKTAARLKLNTVQLHGDEIPEIIGKIDSHVIKSFRISGQFDFEILSEYKNVSYLFDSYSKEEYGGTGKNFNWHFIPKELDRNFILAGGISCENIEEILDNVNPKAIDVSSSLEKSPGIKDHNKVKDFFKKINSLRS
ncbi:MAG: phosphoribosylanthranilate isomerase [Ignavibacteria bacterium]|nr:phosphoribosylanthranilate isomerase [Ignavibacteria bacterium]